MTCANVMSRFGPPVSMGFRCRGSPHISHRSPPKPLRPCISRPPLLELTRAASTGLLKSGRREKRVAFADAKGLSLITVRLFSEKEDKIPCEPLKTPRPTEPSCSAEPDSRTCGLRLGFEPPCRDFHALRGRLQEQMVLLESCEVSERCIRGTVRVKNVCFEKAVHIRITFDSWRSFLDVPCAFLDQCYGEPGADVFVFDISVPERRDPREHIEFCVSYLPAAFGATEWDNNNGKNYRVNVCGAESAVVQLPTLHSSNAVPGSLFQHTM